MNVYLLLGAISAAAWIYLLCGRGTFWRAWREPAAPAIAKYPAVAIVIPARNEAAVLRDSLCSLFGQDYPGPLHVVVVDDHSHDRTADVARDAAAASSSATRLTVIAAPPVPSGWVGKVAAMDAGYQHVARSGIKADYILFTDADIRHGRDAIKRLMARAEEKGYDLVSLMVRLRQTSFAERSLIPAFVFFFRMLYPFAWVNDGASSVAAAAGGCMLLRASALERIGGLQTIKGAIIDDCALARAIKRGGRICLDVAEESASLRGYDTLRDVWRLIARTAFAELRYSAVRLAIAIIGLTVVFLVPPVLAVVGEGPTAAIGAATWAAMSGSFLPCLRYSRASMAWAPLLPLIALFYLGATVDSARRHWAGRGGEWKGRFQGQVAGS